MDCEASDFSLNSVIVYENMLMNLYFYLVTDILNVAFKKSRFMQ